MSGALAGLRRRIPSHRDVAWTAGVRERRSGHLWASRSSELALASDALPVCAFGRQPPSVPPSSMPPSPAPASSVPASFGTQREFTQVASWAQSPQKRPHTGGP